MATLARDRDGAGSTLVEPGTSAPIGPTVGDGGVNFSVYSQRATGMDLLLFDDAADEAPGRVVSLDRRTHRSGGYWHGVRARDPRGRRSTPTGPMARGGPGPASGSTTGTSCSTRTGGASRSRTATPGTLDPGAAGYAARAMKSVVVDLAAYDWEGDAPLRRPLHDTVVYEAHLRGLHGPSQARGSRRDAGAPTPGSSSGSRTSWTSGSARSSCCRCSSSTPWPRRRAASTTGATSRCRTSRPTRPTAAVPTRPARSTSSATWSRRSTGPASRSSSTWSTTTPPRAARTGRRSATAGWATTSTTSSGQGGSYEDYTGTGNTLDANAPIVRRLIVDSLRYWVSEMHVDGFRFDLASVLSRDEDGTPLARPPILWDIDSDPALAGTKLIAEAWDAARAVPGRLVRRRPLGRVERPVPRRRPLVRAQRPGQGAGPSASGSPAARTSTPTRTGSPRSRSTS